MMQLKNEHVVSDMVLTVKQQYSVCRCMGTYCSETERGGTLGNMIKGVIDVLRGVAQHVNDQPRLVNICGIDRYGNIMIYLHVGWNMWLGCATAPLHTHMSGYQGLGICSISCCQRILPMTVSCTCICFMYLHILASAIQFYIYNIITIVV